MGGVAGLAAATAVSRPATLAAAAAHSLGALHADALLGGRSQLYHPAIDSDWALGRALPARRGMAARSDARDRQHSEGAAQGAPEARHGDRANKWEPRGAGCINCCRRRSRHRICGLDATTRIPHPAQSPLQQTLLCHVVMRMIQGQLGRWRGRRRERRALASIPPTPTAARAPARVNRRANQHSTPGWHQPWGECVEPIQETTASWCLTPRGRKHLPTAPGSTARAAHARTAAAAAAAAAAAVRGLPAGSGASLAHAGQGLAPQEEHPHAEGRLQPARRRVHRQPAARRGPQRCACCQPHRHP